MNESCSRSPEDVDRFLVDQIRGGDARAWKQLIERYHGRLSAFARARLNDPVETEDVVQETFVGFVASLKHFDADRSLETYLFSILRYKIGEALTRRQRTPDRGRGFDAEADRPDETAAVDPDTPSGIAVGRELSRRQEQLLVRILRRLISELRDRGKLEDVQVVELLFFVGLRNKDAAARLGRDEKAVAGVKFRALARLREFLDELRGEADADAAFNAAHLSRDATIEQVWREHRLTCLKRSTLGAHLLGVLEEPWADYTRFHVETVACPMCRANLDDLAAADDERIGLAAGERVFQSSVGFLSRTGG